MTSIQSVSDRRVKSSGAGRPVWWLVLTRELADLWIGGKAVILIFLYSIVLGVISWVLASNSELSLIPPKEMVFEVVKITLAVAGIISLIIGADSVSGERERATLEGILLTPSSRRQIILGKLLASMSPWPAILLLSIPYWRVLSQGDESFGQAVLWTTILGTLAVSSFAALGMLVSIWCNTNKTSYMASLGLYLLLFVPDKLPGTAQTGAAGTFLQWINPMAASNHVVERFLVNNRALDENINWLITPILLPVLLLGLLFVYASPGLRLEPGRTSKLRSYWRRVAGLFVIAGFVASLGISPALAVQDGQPQARLAQAPDLPLQIAIDMDYTVVKAGEKVLFKTRVDYGEAEAESPAMIVAMNIINLDAEGEVVDPEDWSPQRTQYIDPLAPGESAELSWRVNAILNGNYMVYIVLVPDPGGEEATSQPLATSGIHLTVQKYTRLNPSGVLPYSLGGPALLLVAMLVLFRIRRRQIDSGGSE